MTEESRAEAAGTELNSREPENPNEPVKDETETLRREIESLRAECSFWREKYEKAVHSMRYRIGGEILQVRKKPHLILLWPWRLLKYLWRHRKRRPHSVPQTEGRMTDLHRRLIEAAADLPRSNGSGYYERSPLRFAIVTDEFMYNYYKDALNLQYVSPENYREVLGSGVDAFLYVSGWYGMQNKDWTESVQRERLPEVLRHARTLGIKIIFQTIEDPSNYEKFLPYARLSDYIFTSAEEKIGDYRRDTGNENVFLLRYGVNPLLHNPVGVGRDTEFGDTVFFAGSWYQKYPERCADARMLFDGVLQAGKRLLIADRNAGAGRTAFQYPEEYRRCIIPGIEHTLLQQAHKLFPWSLNLNSIKASATMCAMRVYEMQALGVPLLSNYSLSVANTFPNVFIAATKEEAAVRLTAMAPEAMLQYRICGIRNMMSACTVYDRLNEIFTQCGIQYSFVSKRVLVICTDERAKKDFAAQEYPHKTQCSQEEFECNGAQGYDFVALFGGGNRYGIYYLLDMINAFKYIDCVYVTKTDGTAYEYIEEMTNRFRTVFSTRKCSHADMLKESLHTEGFALDATELNGLAGTPDLKPSHEALGFYYGIDRLTEGLPVPNGSSYYRRSDCRLAIITDDLSFQTYRDAVNLIYIHPENYREVLDGGVDALLFVTCWQGLGGEWTGVRKPGEKQSRLFEIFDYAKARGIRVLFQSKEDPPYYDSYLEIAKRADVIFTSAAECVDDYMRDTGNPQVYALDYGVNPRIHNPLGCGGQKGYENTVLFAGSWYQRFAERCADAQMIFDGVLEAGKKLVIADRNYANPLKECNFPERYADYVVPAIPYEKLQQAHKLCGWAINLNSVKRSATMCAARTYELQALGCLLLSNDARAVRTLFPGVFIAENKEQVAQILDTVPEEKSKRRAEGIRAVMSGHTVYDKLNFMFEKAYLLYRFAQHGVIVACDEITDGIREDFDKQTYPKKLLLTAEECRGMNVQQRAAYPFLANFGGGCRYGQHYLTDLANGFKYTEAAFVCKKADKEYDYISSLQSPYTAMIDTRKADNSAFLSGGALEGNGLGIDLFEFYGTIK